MRPILFEIPVIGWDVPGYGLALVVGFLLSIWWAARRALKSKGDPDVVLNCGFIALIGGVVGARVMYVWHYWDQFAYRPNWLWAMLDVRQGGLEVYGGVIAVTVSVLIYLWRKKLSIRWYLDILAPSAALGMGIGRIGCLMNGCCWGGVCDLPWAVKFPYGSGAMIQQWTDRDPGAGLPEELVWVNPNGVFGNGLPANPISRQIMNPTISNDEILAAQKTARELDGQLKDLRQQRATTEDLTQRTALAGRIQSLEQKRYNLAVEYGDILAQLEKYHLTPAELRKIAYAHPSLPVHPTQVYSTITLVLLAMLLSALYWRRTRDGQVVCVFLLVEPITRWAIEVLRADNPVDTLGVFTISQGLAIAMSLVGLAGLIALHYLPPRSSRAVEWVPPEEETTPKKGKGKRASAAT